MLLFKGIGCSGGLWLGGGNVADVQDFKSQMMQIITL